MKKLLGSSLVILGLSSLFGYTFAASDCKEVEFEDGTVCVSIEKISDTRFKLEIDDDGVDGPIRCNIALPGYNNNSNAGFLAWSTWSDCNQTFTYDYNKYKNDEATVKIYVRSNEEYPEDREDKPSSNSQRTFPQWEYSFDDGERTNSDNYDNDDDDNNNDGDLDNFDISLSDKTPDTNDEVTLTIKAYDDNDDIMTDYDGSDAEVSVEYKTSSSSSWKDATSTHYSIDDKTPKFSNGKATTDIEFKKDYAYRITVTDEDEDVDSNKIFYVGDYDSDNEDDNNNEDVDNFYLTTNDATPDTDDEVDLTIKARDNDNDTVTDYDGDVEFKVYYRTSSSSSWKLTTSSSYFKIDSDYKDGYSFKSSYKGVKTLSDFITFKKDYDFKVRVEDEDDSKVYGEKIFEVGGSSSSSSSSKVAGFTSKELDTVEELYDEREDMIDKLKDKYSALRNSSKRRDMSDDMYDNMKDVIDDEDDREFEDYDDFNDALGDRYSYTDRIK